MSAQSEAIVEVTMARQGRPWLRAGALFGGVLTWCTAVFGAMVEHELWTGASAGFALGLMLVSLHTVVLWSTYGPPQSGLQLLRRALSTLVGGGVLWGAFVFVTLVLCGRSAAGAMLVLGVLGMLTVFFVRLAPRRAVPRRDRAVRWVRALAWLTALSFSVTVLVPPLAEAMARRARSTSEPTSGAGEPSPADD